MITTSRRPTPARARWPARWWAAVGLAFLLQLGLLFWVGDAPVPLQPHAGAVPDLQIVATNNAPVLALLDPTLFALPHREGFSGRAWLSVTNQPYRPFTWKDEPAALDLPTRSLGAAFQQFTTTNVFTTEPCSLLPDPDPESHQPAGPDLLVNASSYVLVGGLERRRLLQPLQLRSWTNSDLLTNSIIRLLVDAQGRPVSVALLAPGCGSREADAFALAQARTARFNSLGPGAQQQADHPLAGLTWGELVFEWHTFPAAAERAPSAK